MPVTATKGLFGTEQPLDGPTTTLPYNNDLQQEPGLRKRRNSGYSHKLSGRYKCQIDMKAFH